MAGGEYEDHLGEDLGMAAEGERLAASVGDQLDDSVDAQQERENGTAPQHGSAAHEAEHLGHQIERAHEADAAHEAASGASGQPVDEPVGDSASGVAAAPDGGVSATNATDASDSAGTAADSAGTAGDAAGGAVPLGMGVKGANAAADVLDTDLPGEAGSSEYEPGEIGGGGASGTADFGGGSPGSGSGIGQGEREAASAIPGVGSGGSGGDESSGLASAGRSLMAHGQAIASNVGNAVTGAAAHGAQSVVGAFGSMGSGLSSLLGGSISAFTGGATIAGASVVGTSLAASLVLSGGAAQAHKYDSNLALNCQLSVAQSISDPTDAPSADKTKIAQDLYSVLITYGLSKEAVAGILGNFDGGESGLDPTSVETIFDEPYQMGPKKKAAQAVDFDIAKYNPSYASKFPGIHEAGIGLGGWTNSRNTGLISFAKKAKKQWYDPGVQAAYMVGADSGKSVVNSMKDMSGVKEATDYFLTKWEAPANPGASQAKRESSAAGWFAQMANWKVDKDYADAILSAASAVGQSGDADDNAGSDEVNNALASCQSAADGSDVNADNSSEAKAAVSYAWPFRKQSLDNEGTNVYKEVHKYIWGSNNPATNPLQSCDNSVATAVRWSGTDDNYPEQAVQQQLQYLEANPSKWKKIDWDGQADELKPGDVLINFHNGGSSTAHTAMFVGTAIPLEMYHGDTSKFEKGANMVSGSYSGGTSSGYGQGPYSRSPGLGTFTYESWQGYYVFRNIKKTSNSKYTGFKPSAAVAGSDS